MGELTCHVLSHTDFSLDWGPDFRGSVSTESTFIGRVKMKYSSVPYLLYILAKPLKSFEFLDLEGETTTQDEILASTWISFADCRCDAIEDIVERNALLPRAVWRGTTDEGKPIDATGLQSLRDALKISSLITVLSEKDIEPSSLSYVGNIQKSMEFPSAIHLLYSPGKETYIAQSWNKSYNVVRLDEQQTKGIVGNIVRLYGTGVSAALKGLLDLSRKELQVS